MQFDGNSLPGPADLPNKVSHKTNLPGWQTKTRYVRIADDQYFHYTIEVNGIC